MSSAFLVVVALMVIVAWINNRNTPRKVDKSFRRLQLVSAAAYSLGIAGVARLRPGFASLVGLSEVLFAVLWAWLLIGEAMTPLQALGGAVVLAGLALARPRTVVAEIQGTRAFS